MKRDLAETQECYSIAWEATVKIAVAPSTIECCTGDEPSPFDE